MQFITMFRIFRTKFDCFNYTCDISASNRYQAVGTRILKKDECLYGDYCLAV